MYTRVLNMASSPVVNETTRGHGHGPGAGAQPQERDGADKNIECYSS
jgi:hypothetical protein